MNKFDALWKDIATDANDYCVDFADRYQGDYSYICDLISEFADSNVSIYYFDIDNFASNNPDLMRDALSEGYALSGEEYFSGHRNDDYIDYTRHISQAAEFMFIEQELFDNFEELRTLCLWKEINALNLSDDEKLNCFADTKDKLETIYTDDRLDEIADLAIEWADERQVKLTA